MDFSSIKKYISNQINNMAPVRVIIVSFVLIIILGTVALSLPFSTKEGNTSILEAAFTATSATCVTGLSLFDTYSHFTFAGQFTILLLIQVGGLGLATFTTAFFLLFRKKIGYKNLFLFSEASGKSGLDISQLLKVVLGLTFTCEAIGALILMIRFVPAYGGLGVWAAIFCSVSAFCNAGFDVLGFIDGNTSASAFVGDPLVSFTLSALIFVGALGFMVIQDIYINKVEVLIKRKPIHKLSFHSQLCIRVSAILLLVGAVFFFILEYNYTLKDLDLGSKIIASIFQSVNTRTAGFASVNIGEEQELTKLLTIVLMFIGGSPGSTAGGIKVTTFAVLLATVFATLKGSENVNLLGHRFDKKTCNKAITIIFMGAALVIINIVILSVSGNHSTLDSLFEIVSAFGTVGLSTGITGDLNALEQIAIIITMFIGRVGPASLGLAILLKNRRTGETILPEGRTLIG